MPLHRSFCCVHALQIAERNTHKSCKHTPTRSHAGVLCSCPYTDHSAASMPCKSLGEIHTKHAHTHTLTCWSSVLMPLHRSLCCVHALQIAGRNTHKTRKHTPTHSHAGVPYTCPYTDLSAASMLCKSVTYTKTMTRRSTLTHSHAGVPCSCPYPDLSAACMLCKSVTYTRTMTRTSTLTHLHAEAQCSCHCPDHSAASMPCITPALCCR